MSAPLNITTCIDDIVSKLILTGRKLPLHIPAMGNKGGVGCYILSLDKTNGEIEILYIAPGHTSFVVSQREYMEIASYFNSLIGKYNKIGTPLEYSVSSYTQSNGATWRGPFNIHIDPLLPSIFKQLGY